MFIILDEYIKKKKQIFLFYLITALIISKKEVIYTKLI